MGTAVRTTSMKVWSPLENSERNWKRFFELSLYLLQTIHRQKSTCIITSGDSCFDNLDFSYFIRLFLDFNQLKFEAGAGILWGNGKNLGCIYWIHAISRSLNQSDHGWKLVREIIYTPSWMKASARKIISSLNARISTNLEIYILPSHDLT